MFILETLHFLQMFHIKIPLRIGNKSAVKSGFGNEMVLDRDRSCRRPKSTGRSQRLQYLISLYLCIQTFYKDVFFIEAKQPFFLYNTYEINNPLPPPPLFGRNLSLIHSKEFKMKYTHHIFYLSPKI